MLDRSAILRSAWAAYRLARTVICLPGDSAGHRAFYRPLFARMLQQAWADARKAAAHTAHRATAAAVVAAERRAADVRIAAMAPEARSARASAIRDELGLLEYAPLGVRTGDRRANLSAELASLQAA